MDAPNANPERGKMSLVTTESQEQAVVFQPQKLTEIVDMIDLMGKISERMGEDRAQDMGGGAMQTSGKAQQSGGSSSQRDEAIASLPVPETMQQKLVSHIKAEMKKLNREAHSLSRSQKKGSAYALSELYKRIRRMSSLIGEILEASSDMIKRFYIAIFIDRQPLLTGAGTEPPSGK